MEVYGDGISNRRGPLSCLRRGLFVVDTLEIAAAVCFLMAEGSSRVCGVGYCDDSAVGAVDILEIAVVRTHTGQAIFTR